MASGAPATYLDTIHREFKFYGSWPPGSLVAVGEIGVLRDGAFVRTSDLRQKRVPFRKKTVEAPSMRYASERGVEFIGSAKGKTQSAVSAIAKADAGLKINFKATGALAFVLDPLTEDRIDDVDSIADWMQGAVASGALKPDHVIITHVRRAGSGVIAMAQEAGATVQLRTNLKIGSGKIPLAKVGGKLELVTSTKTEFVNVPRGRSGMTPLFRILVYQPAPFPWLGQRGGVRVQLLASRVNDDIGLFPLLETRSKEPPFRLRAM